MLCHTLISRATVIVLLHPHHNPHPFTMVSEVVIPRPPPLPPPLTPPCILGKYQLVRFLGRGSFAKVYEARSLVDETSVAIKVIDKAKTVDASMEPRIIREIDAMHRLQQHPHILRIFEVLASKTKIYLVVELASGGELLAKISRKGRFSESMSRRYFQQLVSALRFCHENGVTHRDIKPQNLLLDKDDNLKVSDFGLSALPEQINNGLLQTACGTPAYTAPEVFRHRGYEGSKADAWSCGVILFVLLAGVLPFDDSNLATMYKKTNRREFVFPEWISKQARYLIHHLLDPNPKTRMSIETLVQTPWFKKSLKLKSQGSVLETELNAKPNTKPLLVSSGLNAFDIISMSSGLDLRGLFETTATMSNRKEKRFTSKASMEAVMSKVGAIGSELGYKVEKGKDETMVGLGKGKVVVIVEALQIVPALLLVAVKVVDGGVEFDEFHWCDMKAGLQDVVFSWHDETACSCIGF